MAWGKSTRRTKRHLSAAARAKESARMRGKKHAHRGSHKPRRKGLKRHLKHKVHRRKGLKRHLKHPIHRRKGLHHKGSHKKRKPMSAAARAKLSARMKAHPHHMTAAQKAAQSARMKAHPHHETAAQKAAQSQRQKGQHHASSSRHGAAVRHHAAVARRRR